MSMKPDNTIVLSHAIAQENPLTGNWLIMPKIELNHPRAVAVTVYVGDSKRTARNAVEKLNSWLIKNPV